MSEKANRESANLENLIEDEWDILRDLKNTMKNPELTIAEKIRVANAIAYHAGVLGKLLARKGESAQLNESTLGDFIKGIEARSARYVMVRFRYWMRRLSLHK